MRSVSRAVQELLSSDKRTLDAVQFEQCFVELTSLHNRSMMINYILAAVCAVAGLWALGVGSLVLGAGLLMAALYFNLDSANHGLFVAGLAVARMLSLRLNDQSREIEALRAGRERSNAT